MSGAAQEPARIIMNFGVDDCRGLGEHFESMGPPGLASRKVEDVPFGVVGTVADPEGNYVNFIQWGGASE